MSWTEVFLEYREGVENKSEEVGEAQASVPLPMMGPGTSISEVKPSSANGGPGEKIS